MMTKNKKHNTYKTKKPDWQPVRSNNYTKTTSETNSRKASYYEKAHRYDLMAYATLLSNGYNQEGAKKALKYFYTDIIDYIHEGEPQFAIKKPYEEKD